MRSVKKMILLVLIVAPILLALSCAQSVKGEIYKDLDGHFTIYDHPDGKNLVLVAYKYVLDTNEGDEWATVLMSGLTLAYKHAKTGDDLGVSMEFQDGSAQAYKTSFESMKKFNSKTLSGEEFIDSIQVYNL